MSRLRKVFDRLDSVFEFFCLSCLAAVVLTVLWQITSRELRDVTPTWSQETSRILLVWIGFLGIALGFREGAHIAIAFVVRKLPDSAQHWVQRFVQAVVLGFGLYLLIQGAQFTAETRFATLPATSLPRSVLYVMMPVAGAMVCIYTVLQALGVRTARHQDADSAADFE